MTSSNTAWGPYPCQEFPDEPEVCDFCFYFDFNGRPDGVYVGLGACWHPEHPHANEPDGGCTDFHCRNRKPTGKTARELAAGE